VRKGRSVKDAYFVVTDPVAAAIQSAAKGGFMTSLPERFVADPGDPGDPEIAPDLDQQALAFVPPDRDTLEDLTLVSSSTIYVGDRKPSQTETIPAPPDSDWDLDSWTLEPPTGSGKVVQTTS